MSYFQQMRQQHGNQTVKLLKDYMKITKRLASMTNRKIFLLKCRSNEVYPLHITSGIKNINTMLSNNTGHLAKKIETYNHRLQDKILTLEIKQTFVEIVHLESDRLALTNQIKAILPNHTAHNFLDRQKHISNKTFQHYKKSQTKKLQNLINKQKQCISTQPKWIKNLTNTQIPPDIQQILTLGPKFTIPPNPKDVNIPRLLGDLEAIISDIKVESDRNLYRAKYTNILTNFMRKKIGINSWLCKAVKETRLFLKSNQNIVFTYSDKGKVMVLMNRSEYIEKTFELLHDQNYYKEVSKDPTPSTQRITNNLITKWEKKEFLSPNTAKSLRTYNAIAPRFYTLPKIHKHPLKMRPICAATNSPTTALAKFIANILSNSYNGNNPYYIQDSFTFSQYINDIQIPKNYVIVSFDVVSLFTNLPLDSVINSLQRHWKNIKVHCSFNWDTFAEAITHIYKTNYLVFQNQFFVQTFGTPMGSNLSPILVNYVLDDLIKVCVDTIDFPIPFIKRYVDDLILALPSDKLKYTLDRFNSQDPHLQFTIEQETNATIPFLDMLIHRDTDNKLYTTWYTKPLASNRYTSYYSYHPIHTKLTLIHTLKHRATMLTHPTKRKQTLNELRQILIENSYPISIINTILFNTPDNNLPNKVNTTTNNQNNNNTTNFNNVTTLDSPNHNNSNHTNMINNNNNTNITQHNNTNFPTNTLNKHITNPHQLSDPPRYKSVAYIKEVTPLLTKLFSPLNVIIAPKFISSLSFLLTKTKQPLDDKHKFNVIYSIPCTGCDQVYIGQTSRYVSGRITSHKSDIRNLKESCALARHVLNKDHKMDFSNTKILATEHNSFKRTFLEMVYISSTPNTMNTRNDIQNLSAIYSLLIHTCKQ